MLRRRNDTVAKIILDFLVTDLPVELFRTCAVIYIWFVGYDIFNR